MSWLREEPADVEAWRRDNKEKLEKLFQRNCFENGTRVLTCEGCGGSSVDECPCALQAFMSTVTPASALKMKNSWIMA